MGNAVAVRSPRLASLSKRNGSAPPKAVSELDLNQRSSPKSNRVSYRDLPAGWGSQNAAQDNREREPNYTWAI